MSIKLKLVAGFALLLLLNGLAATVGLTKLHDSQASFLTFADGAVRNQIDLKTVRAYISDVGRLVNMLDVIEDDAKFADYSQTTGERARKAFDLVEALKARVPEDQRPGIQALATALAEYDDKARQAVSRLTAAHDGLDPNGWQEGAAIARDQLAPAMSAMVDMIGEATDAQEAATQAAVAAKAADYQAAWWQMLGICLVTLIVGGSSGWIVTRRIGQGLELIRERMTRIGEGDIAEPVETTARDEIGDVVRAMNGMTDRLRQVVGAVRLSSSQVASGSALSAQTAEQLSSGSSEQAAASEQASAAVEEMTANVRQNADNAAQTETIAAQANVNAEKTGAAVAQSVEAMRTIAEKITVVQEIARQTDLLALNAAIEAARAGSHGKGFAVVASEVRKLAERSQQAAAEIGELSASTLQVSEEAGRMLEGLVPDIRRTAELVGEISAACREQSIGIEQINQAIQQLDQVTQANAGAANEMTVTAEHLSGEASSLNERAGFFKLDNALAPPAAAAQPLGTAAPAPMDGSVHALQSRAQGFAAQAPTTRKASQPLRHKPASRGGMHVDLDDSSPEGGFERMSS